MADYILPDFKDFDGKVETIMNGGTITLGTPQGTQQPGVLPVLDVNPTPAASP
jgi:hypothetical protein